MKILIDMNLSPDWVPVLKEAGLDAVHWSQVGNPRDSDRIVMDFAVTHEMVIFTHDLDFGAILAATHADAPSVLQLRTQDVDPSSKKVVLVITILREHRDDLLRGALISFDDLTHSVRILPIRP